MCGNFQKPSLKDNWWVLLAPFYYLNFSLLPETQILSLNISVKVIHQRNRLRKEPGSLRTQWGKCGILALICIARNFNVREKQALDFSINQVILSFLHMHLKFILIHINFIKKQMYVPPSTFFVFSQSSHSLFPFSCTYLYF